MIRSPRLLDALSALFVLGAALALVLPQRDHRGTAAVAALVPTAGSRAPTMRATAFDSSYAGIVRGNLFSDTRRTPSSRFVAPPGTFAGDAAVPPMPPAVSDVPASSDAASEAGAATGGDAVPRLYGIVTVDGRRRALLALVPGRAPTLFGDGQGAGRYRVREVRADRVLLSSPAGSRTLRLAAPAAARDTSTPVP